MIINRLEEKLRAAAEVAGKSYLGSGVQRLVNEHGVQVGENFDDSARYWAPHLNNGDAFELMIAADIRLRKFGIKMIAEAYGHIGTSITFLGEAVVYIDDGRGLEAARHAVLNAAADVVHKHRFGNKEALTLTFRYRIHHDHQESSEFRFLTDRIDQEALAARVRLALERENGCVEIPTKDGLRFLSSDLLRRASIDIFQTSHENHSPDQNG